MKRIFFLSVLMFATILEAERTVTPTIINRSQGRLADLKVAGLANKVHLYDMENYYINVDATVGYGQSFRPKRIAECLFGNDLINCNAIKIQGTEVTDRNEKAWLADYFYLAPDYDASFSIKPEAQNVIVNLDLYVSLDNLLEGLYFRAHGPLTWSQWNLHFCEPCDIVTTNSYRPGYFAYDTVPNSQLLDTFGEYARGQTPENTSGFDSAGDAPGLFGIGISFERLRYAKMERYARERTGFADLRFELGYDALQAEDYHVGINVQVVAPTGSRRDAEFAFDPTIGNGNHWEVGAGLSAHYLFWQSQTENCFAGFYLDASITHVNNAREQRTFDLCGRPNSRYMLAMKMGRPVQYLRADTTTSGTLATIVLPISQFQSVYTPVANVSTVEVNVRSRVQADIAAMFNYTSNNWGVDVGYNFWVRSCEKISIPDRPTKDCCPNLCTSELNSWALKGDAAVFGYMTGPSGSTSLAQNDPIPLSGTQCGATIHKGTNADADVTDCTGVDRLQNCGVDNQIFAYGQNDGEPSAAVRILAHSSGLTADSDAIKTSSDPKFINCCDINFQPTRGLSHKVFGNANYTWELEGWMPYVGIGASAEFASRSSDKCCQTIEPDCSAPCTDNCCDICCEKCLTCSFSQWMVWIKGGVQFN